MAIKGKFLFMGVLVSEQAYAVVDNVNVSKGGDAFCHVSIYAAGPTDKEVSRTRVVDGIEEEYAETERERGPVIEHFSVSGIKVMSKDPFIASYEQIKSLEPRLSEMVSA